MTQQQVSALGPSSMVRDILAFRLNFRWNLCVMKGRQNVKTTDGAADEWEPAMWARLDEQQLDTRRQRASRNTGKIEEL